LNAIEIPLQKDIFVFFFSGHRLHLLHYWQNTVFVILAITIVALVATMYPALKAMRLSPLEAIESRE
jgi:ABC-type lipoprotein release transport system permease subunit